MIELGKTQTLHIDSIERNEYILTDGHESVPMPKNKAEGKLNIGDAVEAFIYRENSGELIATMEKPLIEVGEVKKLPIVSRTKIGYFVNIGLDRDVLLPFSETTERLREGENQLVAMYVDKSGRLAMTMNIKDHLKSDSSYKANDYVKGTVYSVSPKYGAFVAIDDKYDALLPKEEVKGIMRPGDVVELRVARVLPDGKINLSMREVAHIQMTQDAEAILNLIDEYGGTLPIGDKSDPEEIRNLTGLSKNAFKRAVGKLYRQKLVEPHDEKVVKK